MEYKNQDESNVPDVMPATPEEGVENPTEEGDPVPSAV